MYPLKFKPIYKKKIWGGRNLNKVFGREIPEGPTGESWEIAAHKYGTSIIKNGDLVGKTLEEAIGLEGEKILGKSAKKSYYEKFPLLVKILDANDKLSLQVHPDDKYAMKHEGGELGKTEMWYIIDAIKGAKVICGLKPGVDKTQFYKSVKGGDLEGSLVEIVVEAGDVIYIPSGTVHSIGKGILAAEIQQNSDTTYRLHDWGRTDSNNNPRKLDIESALDVIDFKKVGEFKVEGLLIREDNYTRKILVASPYFITELIESNNEYISNTDNESFHILIILDGKGQLNYKCGEVELERGETILVPAYLGEYKIEGKVKLLKSYIKEVDSFKEELGERGYLDEDIKLIGALD